MQVVRKLGDAHLCLLALYGRRLAYDPQLDFSFRYQQELICESQKLFPELLSQSPALIPSHSVSWSASVCSSKESNSAIVVFNVFSHPLPSMHK